MFRNTIRTEHEKVKDREPNGAWATGSNKMKVNSEMIFTHKDFKKNTKGYDKITGEIEKRGKPLEEKIFLKDGEDEPTPEEIRKKKKQLEKKKLESKNKKYYKERLRTKWDRAW